MATVGMYIGILAGLITVCSTLVTAYQSTMSRLETKSEKKRLNEIVPIALVIKGGSTSKRLDFQVRRGDITRNEVNGILGMIPMKGEGQNRYSIKHTGTNDYLKQLFAIREDKGHSLLEIPVTQKEFDQFDWS